MSNHEKRGPGSCTARRCPRRICQVRGSGQLDETTVPPTSVRGTYLSLCVPTPPVTRTSRSDIVTTAIPFMLWMARTARPRTGTSLHMILEVRRTLSGSRASMLCRLAEEAGVPTGVVNLLKGARRGDREHAPRRSARAEAVVHRLHRGRPSSRPAVAVVITGGHTAPRSGGPIEAPGRLEDTGNVATVVGRQNIAAVSARST